MVEPHALSVTDAAARLHVTRQAMSNLLGGRAALSAEMAVRFEKTFGLSADTIMRMQAALDLAQVRVRDAAIEVERVASSVPMTLPTSAWERQYRQRRSITQGGYLA